MPDRIEPGAGLGQAGKGPGGEQGDIGGGMLRPDGGKGAKTLHEIAQRAELDDQNPPHVSSR